MPQIMPISWMLVSFSLAISLMMIFSNFHYNFLFKEKSLIFSPKKNSTFKFKW